MTILTTPLGIPEFLISSPKKRAVIGVNSAGFKITVHPAARAGVNFNMAKIRGEFQGMIAPTTPIGSRRVYVIDSPFIAPPGETGIVLP